MASAWGRTEVRGWRGTRLSTLRRHGGHSPGSAGGAYHRRHENAALALLAEPTSEPRAKDRNDVPARPLCYTAYKGAKAGDAFTKYTADLCNNRACGAPIQLSRSSRIIAQRLVCCIAQVLRAEDKALLEVCTDIALTMDGRKSRIVVRARLCMGGQTPEGLGSQPSRFANVFGKVIFVVDRLLSFRENAPFDTTEQLAEHFADAVREACGGDAELFEVVRRKVRVFTLDGAADEQLVGRLTSEVFPNMAVVLRCATHAISGALKAGWAADLTAKQVTKEVVQEVAKYVRSSERFAMTVWGERGRGPDR